uniref:tRNA-guanine transglycosylase n=1 Tax=Haladaptatus sp. DJG-WS-42 TaxID=3120516 RepID=UPI00403F24C6
MINLIGGSTLASGSGWRHFRDNILHTEELQGTMFQAMSFLDYGVTANTLRRWRQRTFEEHLQNWDEWDKSKHINSPIFIDSGGYRLMNSDTFGEAPTEGGAENEWGIYTNPDSVLKLQVDFGGDIFATLDYPIPPDLKEDEQDERMERSIESAVRCLKLIDDPDKIEILEDGDEKTVERLKNRKAADEEPAVFVAIHGHDHETIHWYVSEFLERAKEEGVSDQFHGFAIGSLVPLRSKIDVLVDIVQGATEAIGDRDDIALHVFGIGGKQASLLSLLGVDTFDCSSHMQSARFKKYLVPETWDNVKLKDIDNYLTSGGWPCNVPECPLCSNSTELIPDEFMSYVDSEDGISPQKFKELIYREATYGQDGFTKGWLYGLLARHNFSVYNREMQRVRNAIDENWLLDYVIQWARKDDQIERGLKRAQLRNPELEAELKSREAYDLLLGSEIATDQVKLSEFGADFPEVESNRISLKHTPRDFNIANKDYDPHRDDSSNKDILLIIPCSQRKPYSESRTHKAVLNRLEPVRDRIHKVTISGMYGPVPETEETADAVLEYEYVLAKQDTEQIELVTERLVDYLRTHGDSFDTIVSYAVSKQYRQVIEKAFSEYGRGSVFPTDPEMLGFKQHYKRENIRELQEFLSVPEQELI